MWNLVRMLTVLLCVITMAACGGGAAEKTDGPPPFDVKLTKVDQYSQIGSKIPDGQFVILTLKFKNQSNETQPLNPWDLEIQNITTNPEEQYSQAAELIGGEFYVAYGKEKHAQLLDKTAHSIHPRMEVERLIIFQLPKEANMARYQVYFKPQDLKLPLEADETEVTDHREDAGTYSEDEEAEEGDTEAEEEAAAEPATN